MSNSKTLKSVFNYQSWVHAVAGATGSVVAMSAFYPLDTVRCRLQLEDPEKRKELNTIKIIKQLIQDEGAETLYRGIIPVLESICISNFVYFYTFHSLKALRGTKSSQTALGDLLLGSLAGVVNVLSTTPFWVVNTRLKMKGIDNKNDFKYNNLIDGLIYITKTEGVKSLWSGTLPSLMLVVNPAIQFMTYEAVKRHFSKIYGDKLPGLAYFSIGALAKMVATILTYPLQVIQTKLRHGGLGKNSDVGEHATIMEFIQHVIQKNGVVGLYRGLEAKLLQTVLTAALMFFTYEKITRFVFTLLLSGKRKR